MSVFSLSLSVLLWVISINSTLISMHLSSALTGLYASACWVFLNIWQFNIIFGISICLFQFTSLLVSPGMVNFMCPASIWLNIILVVSVRGFLDEIDIRINWENHVALTNACRPNPMFWRPKATKCLGKCAFTLRFGARKSVFSYCETGTYRWFSWVSRPPTADIGPCQPP